MSNKKFIVIGDVFTDFHNDAEENDVRLGGIFHTARAFHSIGVEYYLACFCPRYLVNAIDKYSKELRCKNYIILGHYKDRPNVMIINDSFEAGNQNYKNVLFKASDIEYTSSNLDCFINENSITDALVYPGDYDVNFVCKHLSQANVKIHFDMQYSSEMPCKIDTLIISTSSKKTYKNIKDLLDSARENSIKAVLFKENRGGTRYFDLTNNVVFNTSAYSINTFHSVGVGDVFNAALLSHPYVNEGALAFSSKLAAIYASTLNHNEFLSDAKKLIEEDYDMPQYPISHWEDRPNCKIYLAAPDFPETSTCKIADLISNKLCHHNFSLFRPILNNGLIDDKASQSERKIIFLKDLECIYDAQLCIAILNEVDTGTAAEIGILKTLKVPIIGFSTCPVKINNFLFGCLDAYTNDYKKLIELIYSFWR